MHDSAGSGRCLELEAREASLRAREAALDRREAALDRREALGVDSAVLARLAAIEGLVEDMTLAPAVEEPPAREETWKERALANYRKERPTSAPAARRPPPRQTPDVKAVKPVKARPTTGRRVTGFACRQHDKGPPKRPSFR